MPKRAYFRAAKGNWMEHNLELPVIYREKEQTFQGRLVTFGYVCKFYILIGEQELIFEKDEEGQYRAFAANEKESRDIDPGLIRAMIETLNQLSV